MNKKTNIQNKDTLKEADTKINRYKGLISAIEFFSQRFELDQLVTFAYEFCNDILAPDKMTLWYLNDGIFSQLNSKGYKHDFTFEFNDQYNQIVYFHAGLMYDKHISTLLPSPISEKYQPDFCIPLIMDKTFFGLIALKRSKARPFDEEDEIVANALMNLYYSALTNYNSYKLLETTKVQLDEKIFNLFAMNHSTRALLSELSLNNLCELAISVFSELTQSSFTSFFIKDSVSENFKLMSYKNVKKHNMELQITLFPDNERITMLPVLIDLSKKKSADMFILSFFNGHEILEKINPEYIVLLKKENELIGFVTLGSKVNGTQYDHSVFELVESLASATYIAIKNAIYIEEIENQKRMINNKLNDLIRLNELMKNMNSAQTYDQVINLIMNTLNVSFGIDMGFFALYDANENAFNITNRIHIKSSFKKMKMNNKLIPLFEGETILIYEEDKAKDYFTKSAFNAFGKAVSGLIMVPVYIKGIDIELIGFFALMNNRSSVLIKDESLVTYDAIATHVAPVVHQLLNAEKIKRLYQPDYAALFMQKLQLQIKEAIEFSLDLFIINIYHKQPIHLHVTQVAEQLSEKFKNVFPIDKRNSFVYTNNVMDIDDMKLFVQNHSDYDIHIYELNKDFDSFNSFLKIFN